MSSGLYRKQYEALKGLAEDMGHFTSTPDGSFNEKFCELCRQMIVGEGATFVPSSGSFKTRKAKYLWQLAVAMGADPDSSNGLQATSSARAIYDNGNDGEEIGDGSLEWRTYLFLNHAVGGPYDPDSILQLLTGYSAGSYVDGISPLQVDPVPATTGTDCIQFNGSSTVGKSSTVRPSQPFTLSFWAEITANATQEYVCGFSHSTSGATEYIYITKDGLDRIALVRRNTAEGVNSAYGAAITTGVYFVSTEFIDDSTIKIKLNGVEYPWVLAPQARGLPQLDRLNAGAFVRSDINTPINFFSGKLGRILVTEGLDTAHTTISMEEGTGSDAHESESGNNMALTDATWTTADFPSFNQEYGYGNFEPAVTINGTDDYSSVEAAVNALSDNDTMVLNLPYYQVDVEAFGTITHDNLTIESGVGGSVLESNRFNPELATTNWNFSGCNTLQLTDITFDMWDEADYQMTNHRYGVVFTGANGVTLTNCIINYVTDMGNSATFSWKPFVASTNAQNISMVGGGLVSIAIPPYDTPEYVQYVTATHDMIGTASISGAVLVTKNNAPGILGPLTLPTCVANDPNLFTDLDLVGPLPAYTDLATCHGVMTDRNKYLITQADIETP